MNWKKLFWEPMLAPAPAEWLIDRLRQRAEDEHMKTGAQVQRALREELTKLLGKPSPSSFFQAIATHRYPGDWRQWVGKNDQHCKNGLSPLTQKAIKLSLRLADTFRAAAIDQLKVVGQNVLASLSSAKILVPIPARWSTMPSRPHDKRMRCSDR